MTPPLPAGFKLDSTPPLPTGFTLDRQPISMGENPSVAGIAAKTIGTDALGAVEGAGTAIENTPHAILSAFYDLAKRVTGHGGEPDPAWLEAIRANSTAPTQELMRAVADAPIVKKATDAIAAADKALGKVSPTTQDVLHQTAGVANDLATIVPVGKAAGDAAEALSASRAAEPKAPEIPSKQELNDQAKAAYQKAEQAGVVVKPESFQGLQQNIVDSLTKEGADPTLHPATTAAVKRIVTAEGPQSLQDVEILRRVAKAAEGAQSADDRRLAGQVVDHIDNFMEGLKPQDVTAGNAEEGPQALAQARNLWSRKRKADELDDLMERATLSAPQFSGSGLENAVRTQFRQLAMNKRRMRTFTPEEQAAIKRVATGGPIGNGLRMVGKFAPTGIVSSALSGGAGLAVGGPAGAVALPVAGFAARRAATALTLRNAAKAGELVRRGPHLPAAAAEEVAAPAQPTLALPAPVMVANQNGVIAREQQLRDTGMTADVRRAGAAHPGVQRLVTPAAPLALPAPGTIPMAIDKAGRAGANATAIDDYRRQLGLNELTRMQRNGVPIEQAAPVVGAISGLPTSKVIELAKRMQYRKGGAKMSEPVKTTTQTDMTALVRKAALQRATPADEQRLIDAGYATRTADGDFVLQPRGPKAKSTLASAISR